VECPWPIRRAGTLPLFLSKFAIHSWFRYLADSDCSRWNTTFGTVPAASTSAPQQTPLKHSPSGAQEIPQLPELHSVSDMNVSPGAHSLPPQQYSGAPIPSFVSPSMWQESVASVYEGGLKRNWDYADGSGGNPSPKRGR
jgi:hypothetical protein